MYLPISGHLDDGVSLCTFLAETMIYIDASNWVPDVYRQACTETVFRANELRPRHHETSRTGPDLEDRLTTP
jgi:hypothetical protein